MRREPKVYRLWQDEKDRESFSLPYVEEYPYEVLEGEEELPGTEVVRGVRFSEIDYFYEPGMSRPKGIQRNKSHSFKSRKKISYDLYCTSAQKAKVEKRMGARPGTATAEPLNEDGLKAMPAKEVAALMPKTFRESLSHPWRDHIEEAEIRELQEAINKGVWGKQIPRPDDVKPIDIMWVYAAKEQTNGLLDRVKARITLRGDQERHALDKILAYAPVHMSLTLRMLIVLHLGDPDVQYRQLDVKNAYLNENMRRKVFTTAPPGYTLFMTAEGKLRFRRVRPGETPVPKWVYELIRALYGGMECGRIFYEAIVDWHLANGFKLIHHDRCYLHAEDGKGSWIKFPFHVDDNAIVYKGEEFYQDYLRRLRTRFEFKEGPLTQHLGVNYNFDREQGTLEMEQTSQIDKFLKLFGMEDTNSVDTPTMSGPVPCEADCAEEFEGPWDMEMFVGHGQYIHQCTRADIGHPLKIL